MTKAGFTMANLPELVGKELGVSSWVEITQQRVNDFADCTNDHQWIHVDVQRAQKESPFGGTIAHGYLTLSLLAGMATEIGIVPTDAKAVLNYGLDKMRFLAPVRVGTRVRARVAISEITDQGRGRHLIKLSNTVEIEGEDKPALIAETLAVFVN